jgi:prolyl-tRNA synthetase
LIGVPYRLTLGDRGLKEGKVEFQHRRDAAATPVLLTEAAALVIERVRTDLSLV